MRKTKLFKFLASLQLAIIVIISFAIITAIGTFVEAGYNATTAKKVVYYSPYMFGVFILLTINLTAVMVDRWPWKRHHTGFVCAHIGIIVMLIGSLITYLYGVDGSMAFKLGEQNRFVMVSETDLTLWATMDGDKYKKIYDGEVDFFDQELSEKNPYTLDLPGDSIEIVGYYPYARTEIKVVPSDQERHGPALRFQMSNERVNVVEWLRQGRKGMTAEKNLGPAKIVMAGDNYTPQGGNELVLRAAEKGLNYQVYLRGQKTKSGFVAAGESLDTGWMGLQFRVLKFLPQAKEDWKITPVKKPIQGVTSEAIRVRFQGVEHWTVLNSVLRLYTETAGYILSYGNRRIGLGFPLELRDFKIGRYQGTRRASSYASRVYIPETQEEVMISMNEPLEYSGYTFYQSSFQEDEMGRPNVSILSVNLDPGRGLKYFGALMIVFGTIVMFYFRQMIWGLNKKSPQGG